MNPEPWIFSTFELRLCWDRWQSLPRASC